MLRPRISRAHVWQNKRAQLQPGCQDSEPCGLRRHTFLQCGKSNLQMHGGREEQVVPDSILASGKQRKHLGMPTASFPSKVERHDESDKNWTTPRLSHPELVEKSQYGYKNFPRLWCYIHSSSLRHQLCCSERAVSAPNPRFPHGFSSSS